MILVTGATGFIGPKIVHALRAEGREVRCLARRPQRANTLKAWGCGLVEADVTDPGSLRAAVAGCDAVVHLVSIIAGRPADFERVMTVGTRNVLAAAREAGVRRFLLMSALGVGEETKGLTPYFRAKWEMEQAVRGSGLDHVIFRPSFVFGRDGGVLPMLLRQVRLLPVTPVVGPGTRRLQPVWVDDVAAHFARAVELEAAAGRTFELGGPEAVTWNELFARLRRVLGVRRPSVHVPFGLARAGAAVAELLPRPPVTRDQLTMLAAADNVVSDESAREVFGLPLVPLDEQIRRAA